MSHRREALAEDIRQSLSNALVFEMRDPGLAGITITGVKLSSDLCYADIRFSTAEESGAPRAFQSLARAKGALKKHLGEHIKMRRVPELRFHFDKGLAAQQRIESILQRLHDEEAPDEP